MSLRIFVGVGGYRVLVRPWRPVPRVCMVSGHRYLRLRLDARVHRGVRVPRTRLTTLWITQVREVSACTQNA